MPEIKVTVARRSLNSKVTQNSIEASIRQPFVKAHVHYLGQPGINSSGGLTDPEVRTIVHEEINADATDDGIHIDHLGNIRLTVGSLPLLP